MTTVGYPDITEDHARSLDPREVIHHLRLLAGYAVVDDLSDDLAVRLVRIDGRDMISVPLDREHPRHGENMRAALLRVRHAVEIGDLIRPALAQLGVDCEMQLTSRFVVGGQP